MGKLCIELGDEIVKRIELLTRYANMVDDVNTELHERLFAKQRHYWNVKRLEKLGVVLICKESPSRPKIMLVHQT